MSGPKTFEAQVDAALKELFKVQTRIEVAQADLSQLSFEDTARHIRFDCREDLNKMADMLANALEPLKITDTSSKNEEKVRQLIENKRKHLQSCLDRVRQARDNFLSRQDDYDAYVDYEQYERAVQKAFEDRKISLNMLIDKYAGKVLPEHVGQIKKAVGEVDIQLERPAFSFGFRNEARAIRKRLQKAVETVDARLTKLREQTGDDIRKKGGAVEEHTMQDETGHHRSLPTPIRKRVKQIEDLIASVDDTSRSLEYRQKLYSLLRSETFREEYFYVELLEDMKQTEATVLRKLSIRAMLRRLHSVQIHPSLETRRNDIASQGLSLLESDTLRQHECENLESDVDRVLKDHADVAEKALADERERQYVKSQIVQSLRRRRYEVVENMEVIDFEKERDFLLKVPGQSNYLNLRFEDDGTFRYNFLITEEKTALGIEGTRQKLSEMKNTCEEFKSLLAELAAQGLKVDLAHELAATEATLLQVPEKYNSRLPESNQSQARKKTVQQKRLKT